MVIIPCTVKCDECGTEVAAKVHVKGCGIVVSGFFGMGSRLGEIVAPEGWVRSDVGIFSMSELLCCSNACMVKATEKYDADMRARIEKEKAEEAARKVRR